MNGSKRLNEIRTYFNASYQDYEQYYSQDHLHFGIWFDNTQTHSESLINTIKKIIECLEVVPGDIVIDAGCGNGGTCRYLSANYDVLMVGITLSERLRQALCQKSISLIDKKTIYYLESDFHNMPFKDDMFNKLLGIESICYSDNITRFSEEAFRILKRDGKLAIADYYTVGLEFSDKDEKIFNEWLFGWSLPRILSVEDFTKSLINAGFQGVKFVDLKEDISRSIDLISDISQARLMDILMSNKPVHENDILYKHLKSGCLQKELFDNNKITYGIFSATKNY